MITRSLPLILICCLFTACGKDNSENAGKFNPDAYLTQPAQASADVVRMNELEQSLKALQSQLEQVQQLEKRINVIENLNDKANKYYTSIYPEKDAFAVLETSLGKLCMVNTKVERLETGHKFYAKICNPLSVTLSQVKLTIIYDGEMPETQDVLKEFKPGVWTEFEWITGHKTAEQLKRFFVLVEPSVISARN